MIGIQWALQWVLIFLIGISRALNDFNAFHHDFMVFEGRLGAQCLRVGTRIKIWGDSADLWQMDRNCGIMTTNRLNNSKDSGTFLHSLFILVRCSMYAMKHSP